MQQLTDYLVANHLTITTAESCTAGLVAATLTEVSGSSEWFERGFVTYSNQAKIEMLGVSENALEQFGAVSEQVASQMVQGARNNSYANVAISITGVAGPTGGTANKPVGTVCFGFVDDQGELLTTTQHFSGDRARIRQQAVDFALEHLLEFMQRQ